jgi:hypothetical protein
MENLPETKNPESSQTNETTDPRIGQVPYPYPMYAGYPYPMVYPPPGTNPGNNLPPGTLPPGNMPPGAMPYPYFPNPYVNPAVMMPGNTGNVPGVNQNNNTGNNANTQNSNPVSSGGSQTQVASSGNLSASSRERSFFTKISQSFFVTKQKVLETIGQAEGSIDQFTKDRIEKLNHITTQYDKLIQLCTGLLSQYKALIESQKLIGEHFHVTGMKEEEILIDPLVQLGSLHRNIDKAGQELLERLEKTFLMIKTYKSAVIADTQLNFERFSKARLEYDGASLRLAGINAESKPSKEKLDEAVLIRDESKKLMDQLGEDLTTKIVILNEKRVHDLSHQLAEFSNAFRNYYISCSKIVEQTDVIVPDDSTAEFKALVSDEKD